MDKPAYLLAALPVCLWHTACPKMMSPAFLHQIVTNDTHQRKHKSVLSATISPSIMVKSTLSQMTSTNKQTELGLIYENVGMYCMVPGSCVPFCDCAESPRRYYACCPQCRLTPRREAATPHRNREGLRSGRGMPLPACWVCRPRTYASSPPLWEGVLAARVGINR